MVRVGVVGAGRIAQRHLSAYRSLGIPVVVTDAIEEVAGSVAKEFGATTAPTVEALLSDDSLAAVDVCTPTPTHAELAIKALTAQKHVFCEKPLCLTVAEAHSIRAAQVKSGKSVMVGYLYRFHPAYQFAKSAIEAGAVGRPNLAIFRLGGRGNARAWKHSAASGGGATLEMLVHMMDIADWLIGPLGSTTLVAKDVILERRHIDGEVVTPTADDYVLARFHAGPTEVICESDLLTPSYMNYAEIVGTNGNLITSILSYLPTVLYCKSPVGDYAKGQQMVHFPETNLFDLELKEFTHAISGGREPIDDLPASLRLAELIDQIRSSTYI